jgi:hypothetical protein
VFATSSFGSLAPRVREDIDHLLWCVVLAIDSLGVLGAKEGKNEDILIWDVVFNLLAV